MKLSKGWLAVIIIAGVLLVDQLVKIWVKTHMYIGQEFVITDWFRIYFIENWLSTGHNRAVPFQVFSG